MQDSDVSAAGAASTSTLGSPGAQTGVLWLVTKVSASYSDPSARGLLEIKSGSTTIWQLDLGAGVVEDFEVPLRGNPGEAVTVTLAAAGGSVLARTNIIGIVGA